MSNKLNLNSIRIAFEKEKYVLLTIEYKNNKQKLDYICPEGHKHSITWNDWQQGKRCLYCSGKVKSTIEFIRKEFKKEKYILLTTEYKNNKQKLDYVCPKGHEHSICWSNWKREERCFYCSDNEKPTVFFIKKEFKKENYILLTDIYKNSKQKLNYICPEGHKHSISWSNWKRGKRCPYCYGNIKLTISFIRKQFEKEKYELLTTKYKNNKQKLYYICPEGHKHAVLWGVWQQGHRCPYCFRENNCGENNSNYNPNLTEEERQDQRKYPEYYEWRAKIYQRDNYTCQICGDNKGSNLNAHHLESYRDNPELRIILENGITLCEECHKSFHYQYGRGNNTKKQFEEFKRIWN